MFCSKPTIRNGFTLLEVVTALLILGTICATALTAMNRAIAVAIDLRKRTQAFEVARENMENLLCLVSVSEGSDFGIDPLHPDIEWETTVESFNEPATSKMWIQAVCTASYPDSAGEIQKVTLTHWLTGLSDKQAQMILDQQKRESEYMDLLNDNDQIVQEQETIREYLRQKGLDIKAYERIRSEQRRQKRQWINEYEYDPDLFKGLMDSLRLKEYEWLDSIGFDWEDFETWKQAQSPAFWAAIARRANSSSKTSTGSGSSSTDPSSDPKSENADSDTTNPRDDKSGDSSDSVDNAKKDSSVEESHDFDRPANFNQWTPEQQKLWEDLIRRLPK